MKINELRTVQDQDALPSLRRPKLWRRYGQTFTQAFRVNAGIFGPGSTWKRAMECTMKSSHSHPVYDDFTACRSSIPIAGMP
jgi:hypothetical protein